MATHLSIQCDRVSLRRRSFSAAPFSPNQFLCPGKPVKMPGLQPYAVLQESRGCGIEELQSVMPRIRWVRRQVYKKRSHLHVQKCNSKIGHISLGLRRPSGIESSSSKMAGKLTICRRALLPPKELG